MECKPKFSFLISSLGKPRALECIQALQNQIFQDFEVILIFDCKKEEIQFDLAPLLADERFKVFFNEKNLGVTKSLNIGLRAAQGEIIVRQDDDDISDNNRLLKINHCFDSIPGVDVVSSWAQVKHSEKGQSYTHKIPQSHQEIKSLLEKRNGLVHSALAIKKSILEEINGYNEEFRFAQDYDLYLRLIRAGATFYGIQEPLVTRYELANTITVSKRMHQAVFSLAALALHVGNCMDAQQARHRLKKPIIRIFVPKILRKLVRATRHSRKYISSHRFS